jgi:hypothetical protein
MGGNFSCLGGNPEGPNKNVSDVRLFSPTESDLKEEAMTFSAVLSKNTISRIQGAVRGHQTRSLLQPSLDAKKEARIWFQLELKYPPTLKALSSFQDPTISKLEASLPAFKPKIENDGVKVTQKPALQLDDGSIYEGKWDLKGRHHGEGCLITKDGTKVVGSFKSGVLQGLARMIQPTGTVFEGEFKNGKLNGQGKIIGNHGGRFEGKIENNKLHGNGKEEWPDGMKYEGDYVNGLRQGRGKIEFGNGDLYEGDFYADKIHGFGSFTWKNGNSYKGSWADGKMRGIGEFCWKDGRVYNGSFVDDQKHGNGVMVWPDGKKYDGDWKNGMQHGPGKYSFIKDGKLVQRTGIWENGSRKRWTDKE